MEYNFRDIETRWQERWKKDQTYRALNHSTLPKYYVLDMFPYPSGAGLHVGHPLGYIGSDIVARYKRLKGFNVLHPMGYDAFGLPAEQYAIQTGQHPKTTTERNIARYREQLDKIGFSYDWSREIRTCDAEYYRWTQSIFLKLFHSWYNCEKDRAESIDSLVALFEKEGFTACNIAYLTGEIEKELQRFTAENWKSFSEKEKADVLMHFRLAYLNEAWVNWCPALGTVLANDEVKDGVSERGGYPVERRKMPQWSLRITSYAGRLLRDLEQLDWSESIKDAQRNWIGKSEGASVNFPLNGNKEIIIEVFTTRPDTLFGVSFVTLAPEHELVNVVTTDEQRANVEAYVKMAGNRSERERQADVKNISGVFTGAYVLHPFNGKKVPVWVGDYVLAGYGTGAVMAVPAHDSRDFAFASHFGLDKLIVIQPPAGIENNFAESSYDDKSGTCINSDFLNGLSVKDAIQRSISELEKIDSGRRKINFRLRDAAFGRQRYWGEPIPVYYKDGIAFPLAESELPLLLPEIDKFQPTETGDPPLARAVNWKYKGQYNYEHTTMPGWAGSSWYFLRYMDPNNTERFASEDAVSYWKQVDLYIGGSEHATGHLLYVRFWTKFLFDLGLIPVNEPAKKLVNQGMIQGVSAFAIRLNYQFYSEISTEQESEQGTVFISKEYFDNLITNSNAEIDYATAKALPVVQEFLQTKLAAYKKENPNAKGSFHVHSISLIHQDVNLLDGDYLPADKISGDLLSANGKFLCLREVEKMSKSKYNVVSPDDIIEQYGADTLRLYEMFLGPLEQSKPWSTQGINGVHNFLRRTWRLFHQGGTFNVSEEAPTAQELKTLHRTIRKFEEDIERLSFNTSVSTFMICVNELTDMKCNKRAILEPFLILLSSYAPHFAEELWALCGHTTSVTKAEFPKWNEEYLKESVFEYPVSVNGKTRFKINLSLQLTKEEVEKEVLQSDEMQRFLQGSPKKVIVVPGRIVNIVV
jgi:leucyl-tRNA synthetase